MFFKRFQDCATGSPNSMQPPPPPVHRMHAKILGRPRASRTVFYAVARRVGSNAGKRVARLIKRNCEIFTPEGVYAHGVYTNNNIMMRTPRRLWRDRIPGKWYSVYGNRVVNAASRRGGWGKKKNNINKKKIRVYEDPISDNGMKNKKNYRINIRSFSYFYWGPPRVTIFHAPGPGRTTRRRQVETCRCTSGGEFFIRSRPRRYVRTGFMRSVDYVILREFNTVAGAGEGAEKKTRRQDFFSIKFNLRTRFFFFYVPTCIRVPALIFITDFRLNRRRTVVHREDTNNNNNVYRLCYRKINKIKKMKKKSSRITYE